MKKQWLSITAALLGATAAMLLCLMWRDGRDRRGSAVAAPLDASHMVFPLADGPSAPPGETALVEAGLTEVNVADTWVIECADCPNSFSQMTDRSLRLDAEGHPRIAYGGEHLYYAWHDGLDWHLETVDHADDVGMYASLALDGSGQPHIGYYDDANADLKYAHWDGSQWHIEIVAQWGSYGSHNSIAVDGDGNPHISYYDAGKEDLWYAYRDGSGWHREVVASEYLVGTYTSIALEATYPYTPHISYHREVFDDLLYAYRDGSGSWHSEVVDYADEVGRGASLALDANGNPHISYLRFTESWEPDELKYAYKVGTRWYSETLTSIGCNGGSTSLALDGMGNPHIGYYQGWCSLLLSHPLEYAYRDVSGWHFGTVDSVGYLGGHPSLALDASGNPHISYLDDTSDDLKHAYLNGTEWYSETVDDGGKIWWHTSLALDASGYAHISSYDSHSIYHGDLKYGFQDGVAWHVQTIDSEGRVGEGNSLALDANSYPHISYRDFTNKDLKYVFQDSAGWHTETVDSEGDVGSDSSIALDVGGIPHIAYYAEGPDDLKYAYKDGSGWYSETVDWVGNVGGSPSLALDANGNPHIGYSDDTNDDLKYAYLDGDGWHIETVDSGGEVGYYASLALDASGVPYISYRDSTNSNLKYAYLMGHEWYSETVDSAADVGRDTSLALDSSGYPHISYYDETNGDLKYAYQNATGWHTVTVDSEYIVGKDTSLALDSDDYPHISYQDLTHLDLKYASYVFLPGPVAGFTASPTSGFAPLTVGFTNTSIGDYSSSSWNFGDSLTSSLESPTHIYTIAGVYTVTLAVNGPDGMDMLTRTNCITVYEPVRADFTASPRSGVSPLIVQFTDMSSGPVATWEWSFGDGGTSALQHPTHTYVTTKAYTVSLTVRAAGGSAAWPGGTDALTRIGYINVGGQYMVYLPLILRNP